jgi:xylulokinase
MPERSHKGTGDCLIGVDLGTSSVKAVAVSVDGQLLARACIEHPMHRPCPGWAENDPDDWYRGVVGCVRALLTADGVTPDRVLGLSIVSQRDPMVLLDAGRRPLTPAISWTDRRTEGQVLELCERFGRQHLIDVTGVVPIAGLSLPILMWTRTNLPEVWADTRQLAFAKDYVLMRLTGRLETDTSTPARSVMNDFRQDGWSSEICDGVGIDEQLLPPVTCRPWERFEELSAIAAAELGLLAHTPLGAGGGDDPSAALGAGAIEEGDLCAGTGTSSDWRAVKAAAQPDTHRARGDVARHVVEGRDIFEVTIESTGSSLRWFRDTFGLPEGDAAVHGTDYYRALCDAAEDVPLGADGLLFLPFVDGGRRAPWYLDGATGSFLGVVSGHTRPHFVRALLEGIAFQYPPTLALVDPAGLLSQPIALVDGEARSDFWNQMKADILGHAVRTPAIVEAAAVGAAVLAAQSAAVFASARDAVDALVHFDRVYEPDATRHELYNELRARHDEVFAAVRATYASQPETHPQPNKQTTEV